MSLVQQYVVRQQKSNYMKFWNASNITGGPAFTGVTTDNQTVFGDGLNVPLFAQANSNSKIISGGASWSGTGYVFDVSALTYWFDGVLLGPTTPTQITLDAADPTNDRFDAIVVDELGVISKITGTASANPVFPAIPDTEVFVQYVYVSAGTTTPVLLQDLMYDENTGPTAEWTASQFDVTTGALGTVNVASTNSPYRGTKCIQATAVNYRRGLKLVRSTATDIQQFAYVQIWYRNDGAALPATKVPYFQFENSAGNPVGSNVNLITYGVSRTIVNTWQLIVVPVQAFGNITNVKGARIVMYGGTLASTASFSLDFMLLSGGILPQGAIGPVYLSPSNTLYSTGAGTGATSVADSIFLGNIAGFQATASSNSIFMGAGAGYNATNSDKSVFIGKNAGNGAVNASWSVLLGENAGNGALNAAQSVLIGKEAGMGANSSDKMYGIGYQALKGSLGYQNMAFGHQAGLNESGDRNLMIGYGTSAGGFSGSIILGTDAVATANLQFMLGSGASPINDIHWQGILTSSDMHDNALAQGNATQQQVRSGTYTPTITGITNVTATTPRQAQWTRVGNVVTVSGLFQVTPTINNAQTTLSFSLPVASNFTTGYEAGGVASTYGTGVTEHSGGFVADAALDEVKLDYFETHGGVNSFSYSYTYEVK